MPRTLPTATEFKARFPVFNSVLDANVTTALLEASRMVSESWEEADYDLGAMLYAAHILTLDGFSSSSSSEMQGFRRVRVGPVELEATAESASFGELRSTQYGIRFEALRRRLVGFAILAV